MWGFIAGIIVGYTLGYLDGRYPLIPPVLRGNYPHCEDKEEQDKEYPTDWR